MKAMILADGNAKELEPLTSHVPKSMLTIANKPILEYSIELCKNHSIDEIKINLHHLPEQIDKYFLDGSELGVKISYSLEKKSHGTAGALKRISNFFDSTFFVLPGGTITNINLTEMLRRHKQSGAKVTIAVKKVKDINVGNAIVFDHQQRITGIGYPDSSVIIDSDFCNTRVYIIEPEILTQIPQSTYFNLETDLFPLLLIKNIQMNAYITEAQINGLTSLKEYLRLNVDSFSNINRLDPDVYSERSEGIYIHTSATVSNSSVKNARGPILIGKNTVVLSGVKMSGPVVIGNEVFIDKAAQINQSVILNRTYIGKNIEVTDAIVQEKSYVSIRNNFSTVFDDDKVLNKNENLEFKEKFINFLITLTDKVISFLCLMLLAPIFLLVAILIKIDSRGPILYVSKRIRSPKSEKKGKSWFAFSGERSVKYNVFRTMHTNSASQVENLKNKYENGPYIKVEDDPRVTRIGKILRKTSIDELPLFWNVLKGNMSLVGIWALPGYEARFIAENGLKIGNTSKTFDFSDLARVRFKGKLGLAGFWQARGRSKLTAEERALHDTVQTVINNQTRSDKVFMGDYYKMNTYSGYWKILFETFKSVIKRTGAV